RYANMDFIFWSAVKNTKVKDVLLAYDVGCQYKINLEERRKKLPLPLRHKASSPAVSVALPVWHGDIHKIECKTENSLLYQLGAAKSDGEALERLWAVLNQIAWQTKEMQPEVRHDAIEDKVDCHNYHKNVGLGLFASYLSGAWFISLMKSPGTTLQRWLTLAIDEHKVQIQEFKDINSTLDRSLRSEWKQMIDDWTLDWSKPSPYKPRIFGNSITKAEVKLHLQHEELEKVKAGSVSIKGMSMTGFLIAGLELEGEQLRIRSEVKASNLTCQREGKVHEQHIAWFKRLGVFRQMQAIYMPGCVALIEAKEAVCDSDAQAPAAEEVRLWLPSQVPSDEHLFVCDPKLFDTEFRLCEGQCADALTSLRSKLMACQHLIRYRNANIVGQRMSTRARTIIDTVSDHIDATAEKYCCAREAMVHLRGEEACGEYKVLAKDDITAVQVQEQDAKATKKLSKIGGRQSRGAPVVREKPPKISWIWMALGGPGSEVDGGVHESVRVEWLKALAQKTRWCEEVALLHEEMKRTCLSLRFKVNEWQQHADQVNTAVVEEVRRGRHAYALKQSMYRERMSGAFEAMWGRKANWEPVGDDGVESDSSDDDVQVEEVSI
ncbi:hypothetical protein ARMSODRAFT_887998, partial [Armillaria solidipes]